MCKRRSGGPASPGRPLVYSRLPREFMSVIAGSIISPSVSRRKDAESIQVRKPNLVLGG